MKLLGIVLFSLILEPSTAFAPFMSNPTTTQTSQLRATNVEGWKIDGKIKPTNNFILVKKTLDQKETESGILLSKTAKIVKTEGTVVDVGPGKPHPDSGILFPMPVEEGDNVIYGKYDGTEVKIDGIAHSLIRDDDILVKFKGDTLTLDNVETVNNGVLVHVVTREEETSGGLILGTSKSSENRPSTGTVVKVGPGKMVANGDIIPMKVKVGDEVKFMDFAGNEVKIGDEDYSVVKMDEIMAKF